MKKKILVILLLLLIPFITSAFGIAGNAGQFVTMSNNNKYRLHSGPIHDYWFAIPLTVLFLTIAILLIKKHK